jgi:uncharacterized Zn finger protein
MKKRGRKVAPVEVSGRKITTTFWGDAWCRNLESYSDYSNRLPRGRTYVRNGSVFDLQMETGRVRSLVSGSSIYEVDIKIGPVARKQWNGIKDRCAGQVGSVVELLRGSMSTSVMEIVTRKGEGLFPTPQEIGLGCSCPDWATMCKHVAAVLYGVGARLDHAPQLLFTLRGVDPAEMVEAAIARPRVPGTKRSGKALADSGLSEIFGVDIDFGGTVSEAPTVSKAAGAKKAAAKRSAATKKVPKKPPAKKNAAKKPTAKKPTAKKPTAKKPTAKKPTPRTRPQRSP